jgi:hypothetical protein
MEYLTAIWGNSISMCISVRVYFPQIYGGTSNETHSGIVLGEGVEDIK